MTECELIQSIRDGDRDAFAVLMDRYYGMVYGVCYRMTGNAPDAEELTHDTFVEAYLKLDQLREPARFGGWLKAMTLNLCRMWYRQHKRDVIGLPEDLPIETPVDEEDDRSLCARMSYGLSRLSYAHRLVLVLHYFEELPYEEIAKFMEIPVGTVMSRLHRAREALRKVLREMTEDEEIPTIADGRFKEEVQAEIAVLLEAYRNDPTEAERLTLILNRSPEFVERLIADAQDAALLHNLAILLPRMGADAIDRAIDACFSSSTATSEYARTVVREYSSRLQSIPSRGWQPDMPSRDAYVLLDRVLHGSLDEASAVDLLIELLDSCKDTATTVLLTNALLCYPNEAFERLLSRFQASADAEDVYRPAWVIQALCRTGARFGAELASMIESSDDQHRILGLTGLEAIARCLQHSWLRDAAETQFANEVRIREKWAPLRRTDIGEELLRRLTDDAAALLGHERADLRNAALRVLGYLRASEYSQQVRACASHVDPSTRVTVIQALSEIGDLGSAEMLMEIAIENPAPERLAAVTALGRMNVKESAWLLADLTRDPDRKVQDAAVTALGSVGGEQSETVLKDLMRTGNPAMRKLAAGALYGGPKQAKVREPSEVERRLAEKRRRQSKPVAFISLDATIRYAIPEIRAYDEKEITANIAGVCEDYCTTRRFLIEHGFMSRAEGIYELTDLGQTIWRVEHCVMGRYLRQ